MHVHVLQLVQDNSSLVLHLFAAHGHAYVHEYKALHLHRGNRRGERDLLRMQMVFMLL